MSNLFAGFDLAIEPSKTVVTETRVKNGKVEVKAKVTNQGLFTGTGLEEFDIELNKTKPEALAKKVSKSEDTETDPTKILKSKKVSLEEKLSLIKLKVLEVLGKQKKTLKIT